MPSKLNRSEILHSILRALVDGWGYGAVRAAFDSLGGMTRTDHKSSRRRKAGMERGVAVALVEELSLSPERRLLLRTLAMSYEEGTAFPTLGDARAFLLSHHRDAKDISSRPQAFKRMLPILAQMSEKGLEKVISRSHHSGPAELEPISKAIRGAGETMRRPTASEQTPSSGEDESR